MSDPAPSWKFYHPLKLWEVLLVVFVSNVLALIPTIALREGLGLPIPIGVAGGVGGVIGVLVVMRMANKRKSSEGASEGPPGRV